MRLNNPTLMSMSVNSQSELKPVLGIIPARGGSKRFPGKNLVPLAGKPLLVHSIETCLHAKMLDRVIVSSEDDRILAVAENACPGVALRRPDHLAQDTSLVYDTAIDALGRLEALGEGPYQIVALIQCTSPLTIPLDIDGAINELIRYPEADSVVTVVELDHYLHPTKLNLMKEGWLEPCVGTEQAMQPAHMLEKFFLRNGSAYVSRRSIFEQGRVVGERCRGYVMPPERSVDINRPIDLNFAEFLLSRAS